MEDVNIQTMTPSEVAARLFELIREAESIYPVQYPAPHADGTRVMPYIKISFRSNLELLLELDAFFSRVRGLRVKLCS